VLALAVFAVGLISQVYDGASSDLRSAINQVLPGIIGPDPDQLSLDDVRSASGWAGVAGLVGLLYSGLGWVSALRDALIVVFALPQQEQPGFVTGKLRDLVALVSLGVVLFVAVAVTGFLSGFSGQVVGWFGLGEELGWIATAVTVVIGLAANALLFFMLFRILGDPHLPPRALWKGAIVGAIGFEVLKQASKYLLETTKHQPAFQAFGIALILLVWIGYSSRLILYSAAFAYTTPEARLARMAQPAAPVQGPPSPPVAVRAGGRTPWRLSYAAGAATTLGLMAAVRSLTRRNP
jgi:membrane protein